MFRTPHHKRSRSELGVRGWLGNTSELLSNGPIYFTLLSEDRLVVHLNGLLLYGEAISHLFHNVLGSLLLLYSLPVSHICPFNIAIIGTTLFESYFLLFLDKICYNCLWMKDYSIFQSNEMIVHSLRFLKPTWILFSISLSWIIPIKLFNLKLHSFHPSLFNSLLFSYLI
jgi:hypothetical protein